MTWSGLVWYTCSKHSRGDIVGNSTGRDPGRPWLPASRAFVVQLSTDSDAAGELSGRVEHIETSRSMCFATTGDLLAFMLQILRAAEGDR